MKKDPSLALFKKHTVNLPTILGWVVISIVILSLLTISIFKIQPFLAISNPLKSKTLIVEGWVPDYCLEQVYMLYKIQEITTIMITGGPLEQGSYLKEYKSFAALGAATLRELGIPDSVLIEIPASYVKKDRTYTSAIALKNWLSSHNKQYSSANIITLGIHARRSNILFKKILNNSLDVGVISIQDRDYNPDTWFASSIGFKMIITELISYLYTKVTFYSQ